MAIYDHITEFNGKPVINFDYKSPEVSPLKNCYRLIVDWDLTEYGFTDSEQTVETQPVESKRPVGFFYSPFVISA